MQTEMQACNARKTAEERQCWKRPVPEERIRNRGSKQPFLATWSELPTPILEIHQKRHCLHEACSELRNKLLSGA